LLSPKRYLKEMDKANLPADWRKMILGENLAQLLGW
jgi:predicted TIM-barrel fold metal-dependent hydrolase